MGHDEAAVRVLQDARATIEAPAQSNPSHLLLTWRLAQCYEALGGIAERSRHRTEARQWYARSFDLWKQWKQAGRPSSGFLDARLRSALAAFERVQ